MSKRVIGYHFVNETLRNGEPVPSDGVWLIEEKIRLCNYGLHASLHPFDALKYAPGNTLCLVELGGEIEYGDDKLVAQKRKILTRFNAGQLLYNCARKYALDVIHLWDAPDVVKEFLETGDEKLRAAARAAARGAARAAARAAARDAARDAARAAARYAAWDAARYAAWAAARDAAWAAAWDAARGAQAEYFKREVENKFSELGYGDLLCQG